MPPITCHVLDTTKGKPAQNVTCALYYLEHNPQYLTNSENDEAIFEIPDDFRNVIPFAIAKTNSDGRIPDWIINKKYGDLANIGISKEDDYRWSELKPGVYKIRFHTKQYFLENEKENGGTGEEVLSNTFFPFIEIHFVVNDPPDNHYHVPLLLSNHSYTTYRGS